MSTSLSASVAIPGIPKFYKSNVQGSNKSISVIPDFVNGLNLKQNERSGLSEVDITLLGVKREESKSILLENVFIYGVDTSLWLATLDFVPTSNYWTQGYCSITNSERSIPPASTGQYPWVIKNKRVQGNQILAGQDAYYEPNANFFSPATNSVTKINSLVGFPSNQRYVLPIIYHDSKGSCVTLEAWIDPYITPWWGTIPGEFCGGLIRGTPYTATLGLETTKAFKYEPGKATTFTMGIKASLIGGMGVYNGAPINSRAMWGARNETDSYRFVLEGDGGFYVERVTPYAETSLRVNRANFIDPLDGTGPSGITIDFTKVTMYSIEFSWYGAVGANFFAYIPVKGGECKWVKLATLLASNRYTRPVLSNPNLKLFTELFVPMGCTQLQTMSLYGSSVYIDGNFRDTLKYFVSSPTSKKIDQKSRTYITYEIPNFSKGLVSRPRNAANDYPKLLNGISTIDAQIELYESDVTGGAVDINTAYYESSITNFTPRPFLLLSDIYVGGSSAAARTITVSAINFTEDEKIEFMRRVAFNYLSLTNPTSAYSSFSCAGAGRLSGQWNSTTSLVQSVCSKINDNRIILTLDRAIETRNFFAYTNVNTQRNALSTVYPVVSCYPILPGESIVWSPSQQSPGTALFSIAQDTPSNRSFVITKQPIKSGTASFDTDLLTAPENGFILGGFGVISETEYNNIKNENWFLDTLDVNPTTSVQLVTTTPTNEFNKRSEFIWRWNIGTGGISRTTQNFPLIGPFANGNTYNWVNLPGINNKFAGFNVRVVNPSTRNKANKDTVASLIDINNNFTVNVDVREHEFIIYGYGADRTSGPDPTKIYYRVSFKSKDLFAFEDGTPTNSIYNFKMLVYAHNGGLMAGMAGKTITSPLNNWIEPGAVLLPFSFGPGTTWSMTDAALENNGILTYTVGLPISSTAARAAFISNPNIQFKFKTIFLRNIIYKSPTSILYQDRNAGLWYATYYIDTLESVHIFALLESKNALASTTNRPQRMLQATAPISRPMITNFQYSNARDKNDIIMSETPQLEIKNVTVVRSITSTVNGVLDNLPLVNFNFETIPGLNILQDIDTSQPLIALNKTRRFTFTVNGGKTFKYDLSSVYNPSRFVLAPLGSSILNRDFKRFYVTAKSIKNESLITTPWAFSQNGYNGTQTIPYTVTNPINKEIDATTFSIDTRTRSDANRIPTQGKPWLNTYIQNTLKTVQPSDQYYIWSIYAKPLSPALSGRYIIFEQKTGPNNRSLYQTVVYFDIIDNRIGFWRPAGPAASGSNLINGSNLNFRNSYLTGDQAIRAAFNTYSPALSDFSSSWFAGSALPQIPGRPNTTWGYADLKNKINGRYTVAAHIEDVGEGWKRVSACTYYYNNHNDNVVYIGFWPGGSDVATNPAEYIHTVGNVSLWGFKEEVVSDPTTVETLSAWFPTPYTPQGSGYINLNLITGEQL